MARIKYAALGILIILMGLSGCMYARYPVETSAGSPDLQDNAVLLIRLQVYRGGELLDDLPGYIYLGIENVERGEPMTYSLFKSPSEDARRQGWVYTTLKPGVHRFAIATYGTQPKGMVRPEPGPQYLITVPAGKPLIYGGSLSIRCDARKKRGWLDAWPPVEGCYEARLSEEEGQAAAVANSHFRDLGMIETVRVQPASVPFPRVAFDRISPLEITTIGTRTVTKPTWIPRAVSRTTGIGRGSWGGDLLGAFAQAREAGGVLMAAYLAYIPLGTAVGIVGGAHSANKWGPCVEKVSNNINGMEPEAKLHEVLSGVLKTRNLALRENSEGGELARDERSLGAKGTVEARIQDVVFRECSERWTFSVEFTTHVRLWDVDSGRCLYEEVITPATECRQIEDYCGAEGTGFVRDALEKSMDWTVNRLLADWTLEEERSDQLPAGLE
jgi:hypothetical protein